jgi:AcrR family transcriptional regulator
MPSLAFQNRLLAAVAPGVMREPPARWQQRKSARTRLKMIVAAVECLVESGYAGLSTAAVAERCAVSRGTMHHHFATRIDLVAAVTEHVFYNRMQGFLEEYTRRLADPGTATLVEVASEAYWHSVQSSDYAAYIELAAAARTDGELQAVFDPASQRFDRVWTEEMVEAFPQWKRHYEVMKLANDFTIAVCAGLVMERPVFGPARVESVRALATRVVENLYREP